MRRLLGVLLAIPLASCVTAAEREQAEMAGDDTYCRSLGVAPGSPPYVDCRLMVKNIRMRDQAVRGQMLQGTPIGVAKTILGGN